MTKINRIFALAILFLLTFSFNLYAVDVGGDWELTMVTQQGEMTQDVTFVQDGEKLSVTMKSQRGESTGEGTIKDNEIEWSITRSTPRGDMTMTYKGTVEGDTMSGEVQIGDFGSAEWKATKIGVRLS